jgi:hypothetical protein
MSEQVSLVPLVEEARRPRSGDGPAVVVPISQTISAAATVAADATASVAPPASEVAGQPKEPAASERRRGGRWLVIFCALVALIAAAISLAAPTLRPVIADAANAWVGEGNAVSRLLAPSPAIEAGWRLAREQAMQALNAHLAEYDARIGRLVAAQQATNADVTRAVAALKADHAAGETLARAVDKLSEQTRDLRSVTLALDGRVRATGLLTLALRLRRDVDAGLPINREVAALASVGPFPAGIDRALQQLRRVSAGAPTMRDLADEFDVVVARLAARSDAAASWTSRGWTRVTTLFGGAAPAGNAKLVEHLRALARDGRFSEAADEIDASNDADIGADWVARVRARATAVVATQALLSYSLAAYENAFAAPDDAGGKPTQ